MSVKPSEKKHCGRFLDYDRHLVRRAREMRAQPTAAERKLWRDFLRQLPVRVLRQRSIDRYIVDFYCPSQRLVIEVDGDSHYENDTAIADQRRTARLVALGLRVVRVTNEDVLTSFPGVCEVLARELGIEEEE